MKIRIVILIISCSFFSCNKKAFTGSIYLAGYETKWEPSEEFSDFVKYQALPKDYMKNVPYGTELLIENNQVTHIYEYNYGRRASKESFAPFKIKYSGINTENNIPFSIEKTSVSNSFLGGSKPSGLMIPNINSDIAFQYFGTLSAKDFPNKILNFDLHLVAPIYDSFDALFMDYSNPIEPKIINPEASHFSRTFEEMNSDSKVVYEKTPIKYVKGGNFRYHMGNTGVPSWIQRPYYPINPKNGKKMIFLAAFDTTESREQIDVQEINFEVKDDYKRYFQKLDFWSTGSIYIFIDPTTRTVCYFLQTT